MSFFLDWESDGFVACAALVLYGLAVLAVALPRFRRCGTIARLLPAALVWHFVSWAFISFWMLPYYAARTGADCYGYHHNGIMVARSIRTGDWGSIPWGVNTAAMPIITGFLYAPFGGDIYGILFFSAVLGFCGGLYLCLAFSLWVTPAQLRRYCLVVLFLPSFVTWTATFGKDSWMGLGLGLVAYGYSSMLKVGVGHSKGIAHLLCGFAIVTVVRPHIAVTVAASMALAYLWGMTQKRRGSILAKFLTIVMLIAMVGLLAAVARGFLGLSDLSADTLEEYTRSRAEGNAIGGSVVEIQTAPGVAGALLGFPRGVVRVLFQPFPWEIHNFNAGLAAGENLFIFWFVLSHAGYLRKWFRGMVREPYVLFSSVLACAVLLMLSFAPNLGAVSRQRAQLLPFLFAPLVAAEAVRKRAARRGRMTRRARRPITGAAGVVAPAYQTSINTSEL